MAGEVTTQPDSETHDSAACPLCGEPLTANWSGNLYKVRVCESCRRAFARRRYWAYFVDSLAFSLLIAILQLFLWIVDNPQYWKILDHGGQLLAIPFLIKDGFNGQSPGKWLFDLRVIDPRTARPQGFWSSFLRNIPAVIGPFALWIFAELRYGPRLGDGWAHSKVIWWRYRDAAPFRVAMHCNQCGYDLTGNVTGRCPECGESVSKVD